MHFFVESGSTEYKIVDRGWSSTGTTFDRIVSNPEDAKTKVDVIVEVDFPGKTKKRQ